MCWLYIAWFLSWPQRRHNDVKYAGLHTWQLSKHFTFKRIVPALFCLVFSWVQMRRYKSQNSGLHVHWQAWRGLPCWMAAWCWHYHPRSQGINAVDFLTRIDCDQKCPGEACLLQEAGWAVNMATLGGHHGCEVLFNNVCDQYCVTKQHLFSSSSYKNAFKRALFEFSD